MSTTNQNQSQKPKEKETPYVIEEFLDLDPAHFTFLNPKANDHGGHFVPIRYKGKTLYVKYSARTSPFGISTGKEQKDEYAGIYPEKKKITGYSTSISCLKEYEDDPYYKKGLELDEFFIKMCHKNAMAWHIGGTKNVPLDIRAIQGYDDRGCDGKWKRLLKWSYKKDGQGERNYLDYPPRLEFGIPTTSMTEYVGSDGLKVQEAIYKPVFFDIEGTKLEPVSSTQSDTVLPKFSRIAVLAQWSTITQGTYGATMKPKAQQFRVFPNEALATDECLLDDDEEEHDLPDQFAGDVAVTRTSASKVPSSKVPSALIVNNEDVEEDVEEIDIDDGGSSPVAPAPAPVRATRRIVTAPRK
jgi:hypothetical protein